MKKNLTFIPLGIGISSAIIYLFNIFRFRIINNAATLMQIISNLKIYLYVSIAGFLLYFFIKVLIMLNDRNKNEKDTNEDTIDNKYDYINNYEPFELEKQNSSTINEYLPNYDYVPLYKKEDDNKKSYENEDIKDELSAYKHTYDKNYSYCYKCGEKISSTDIYCRKCGYYQKNKKHGINPMLKNIINVLEIVILILILYFLINMLFEYKEKTDNTFKSPFRISMTN